MSGSSYYGGSTPDSSFGTAANLSPLIDGSTLTAQVNYLDITTTSEQEYFSVTAPAGTSGTLTVSAQSAGLSLLTPSLTVYAANQSQLGSASVSGYQGDTATVTVTGVAPGQQFYLKVSGVDTTAFSTGCYALTLNFGSGSMPAVPIPNTQVAQGSPHTTGGGQAIKLSMETLVNTSVTYTDQANDGAPQAVGVDSYGNHVVVWSSLGQDGSGWGVYGQRYNASGAALGGEFRVNTTTAGDQEQAAVAMDAAGNFVVVWSSLGQDGSGWGVYGQRYNLLGLAVGGEFRVNTTTAGDQEAPSVAMDSSGNFVVVWQSNGQDGSGWGVYGQRYSASGAAQGGEFRINTTTTNDQTNPVVASDSLGNFVVVWQSNGQDGSGWGVYGQRYSASGAAQGGEFRINTTTTNDQVFPAVAMNAAGAFVVTWSGFKTDSNAWDVYEQRYNALGVAQGGETRVNHTQTGDQQHSSVALDTNGNFLVVWQSANQDGGGWGIYGQQYKSDGGALGTEFLVNTTTAGDQKLPAIAMNSVGDAVVVWSGNGTGDTSGVFRQMYVVGPGNGMSSNEAAYDTFNPNGCGPGCQCPACRAAGVNHGPGCQCPACRAAAAVREALTAAPAVDWSAAQVPGSGVSATGAQNLPLWSAAVREAVTGGPTANWATAEAPADGLSPTGTPNMPPGPEQRDSATGQASASAAGTTRDDHPESRNRTTLSLAERVELDGVFVDSNWLEAARPAPPLSDATPDAGELTLVAVPAADGGDGE